MGRDSAGRVEWIADDHVGKSFIVMFTNCDLPSNPRYLGECLVCGGVFTRDQSMAHLEARRLPSPEQPYAIVSTPRVEPTHSS
jgi:hypothetical protein